jgi:hypothetical protein
MRGRKRGIRGGRKKVRRERERPITTRAGFSFEI